MDPEIELQSALQRNFKLELAGVVSREAIINALTFRVAHLLNENSSRLFSLLYRLDISERNIKQAMATRNEVPKKIAILIYERQLEKIISRQRFKSQPPDDDLAW